MYTFRYFLSDFSQVWILSTDFHGSPDIKFHENSSCGSRADTNRRRDGRVGGRTGMTKLIVAFREYVNAPK
jgi:hypothetical protein